MKMPTTNLRSSRLLLLGLLLPQLKVSNAVCFADNQGKGGFNNKCGFPFTWQGRTYNSCTTADNGNTPWCFWEGRKGWGHCTRTPECLNPGSGSNPAPTPPPTPSVPPPGFPVTPQPTMPIFTPQPTRSPTRHPTQPPTRSPTPFPITPKPTPSPTGSPTTGSPSSAPSPAPTPETPPPQGELLSVQLSPFTLNLLLDGRRRRLQQETDDALFDLVYSFLMPYYAATLSQSPASLELSLLNSELDNGDQEILTRLVLGTVYFVQSPRPSQQEVDDATSDALSSQDFLLEVRNSGDPVLKDTKRVDVVVGFIEGEPNDNSGDGGDSGNSGLFVFSIIAAVICGIAAVGILALVMYRGRKEKQTKEVKQENEEEKKEIGTVEKHPDTPTTVVSGVEGVVVDTANKNNAEDTSELAVGSEMESVYSYKDGVSMVGSLAESNISYAYPDEDLW